MREGLEPVAEAGAQISLRNNRRLQAAMRSWVRIGSTEGQHTRVPCSRPSTGLGLRFELRAVSASCGAAHTIFGTPSPASWCAPRAGHRLLIGDSRLGVAAAQHQSAQQLLPLERGHNPLTPPWLVARFVAPFLKLLKRFRRSSVGRAGDC